jgi:hypothetical protein
MSYVYDLRKLDTDRFLVSSRIHVARHYFSDHPTVSGYHMHLTLQCSVTYHFYTLFAFQFLFISISFYTSFYFSVWLIFFLSTPEGLGQYEDHI